MNAASFRGRGSSQRGRIRELGARNPQPNFNQPRRDINLPPAEFFGLDNLPFLPWQQMNGLPPQPQQYSNFESHRYLRGRPQYCPGIGVRGRSKRIRGEGRSRPGLLPVANFGGSEPSRFPPLGSEEERQQKIAETADKLKLKLSSLNIEEPVNFWEDDLSSVNFSQEIEEQVPVANRGIPELRHDPPELNLTVNDFKDIGRVDPDNSFNSGDSVEILSPEIKKSKTQVAEENPVDPKTRLKTPHTNLDDDVKDTSSPRSSENVKETTTPQRRTANSNKNEPTGRNSEQAAIERLNYALACDRKTSTPNPVEKEAEKEIIIPKHKPELTKSLEKLREVIKVDRELEKEEKSRAQPNPGPRLQPDVRMDFHPGIGPQYPRFQPFNHNVGTHEIRNRIPPQFRNDHPSEIQHFGNDYQLSRTRNFNFHPRGLDPRIIHPEFNGPIPPRVMNRNSDLQLPFDPREPPPRFNAPYHDDYHRNQTWYNNRNDMMQKFCPPSGINGLQQSGGFNHRAPPHQRFINQEQEMANFGNTQEFSQIGPMGYPHVPHIMQHQSGYFNPAMPPPNTAPCIIHKFPPPSVPHSSSPSSSSSSSIDNNQTLNPPPPPTTPLEIPRPPSPPKISKEAITNQTHTPNMNDELEDMQEALEFAKKLMNMTEEDEESPQSFNMPVFPDLPLIPSTEPSLLTDKLETLKSGDLRDREKGKQDDLNQSFKAAQADEGETSKSLDSILEETKQRENKNNAKVRASSSKPKTLLASTLESIWKEKVINRFLKMSKNDICNMVNSSGKRKNDIVMKHLVKEQKHSLSQERRCSADDAVKGACDISQEEEFISQLKAVLDPSATVDIKNLPAEFIQQLSEVLKLDVESHLNDSADFVENNNLLNNSNVEETQSLNEFFDTSNIEIQQNLETNVKTEIDVQSSEDFRCMFGGVDDARDSPFIDEGISKTEQVIPRIETSQETEAKSNSHGFIRARCTRTMMSEDNDDLDDMFCADLSKPRIIEPGVELWSRKKHPDIFRNLTKEEFEAKELRNHSGTPSSSRETSVSARSRSPKNLDKNLKSRNESPMSPSKESNFDIDSNDYTTNDAVDNYSDCSSISSDSEESSTSNVTKLLKVIKEKEKIAKDMSLSESMREVVAAEIEKAKEKDREMEMDRKSRNNQKNRRRKERKKKQKARNKRRKRIAMDHVRQESFVKEELIIEADNERFFETRNNSAPLDKPETINSTLQTFETNEETSSEISIHESVFEVLPSFEDLNTESLCNNAEKTLKDGENQDAVVAESPWGKFEAIETRKPSGNAPIKKIDIEAYKARKLQKDSPKDDKLKEIEPISNREQENLMKELPPSENEKKKKISSNRLEAESKNEKREKNETIKKSETKEDRKSSNREKGSRNHDKDVNRSSSRDDSQRNSKEKSRHSSREKKHDNVKSVSVDESEQKNESRQSSREKNHDNVRSVSVDKSEQRNDNVSRSREKKSMERNERPRSRNKKNLTDENELTRKENHRHKSPERKENPENCEVAKTAEKNSENLTLLSLANKNISESIKSKKIDEPLAREEGTTEKVGIETTNLETVCCDEKLEKDSKKHSVDGEAGPIESETLTTSESTEVITKISSSEAEEDAEVSNDVKTVLNNLIDKAISQLELLSNKIEAKETNVITAAESEDQNTSNEDGGPLIDNNVPLDFPETPEDPLKGFSEETIKSSILGKRKLDQSVLEITEDYILNKKSKEFDDMMLGMIAESSGIPSSHKNQITKNNSEIVKVKIETEEVFNDDLKDENPTKCVTPSGDTLSLGSTIDFDHNEFIVLSEISSDEDFSQDEDRKSVLLSQAQNVSTVTKIHNKHKEEPASKTSGESSSGVKTQRNKKEVKNSAKPATSKDDVNKKPTTKDSEKMIPEETESSKKAVGDETLIPKKSSVVDNDNNKKKNSESKRISKQDETKNDKNLHRISHKHKTKHKKDKKWKPDEKPIKEIVKNEEIVTVVKKRQTKEDVMARMVEIDLEIHKLMSEKMKLYQMLEGGDLPSDQNLPQLRNDLEDAPPETSNPNPRSSNTNEICKSTSKQKPSVSKAPSETSIAKSSKISEDGNQTKKSKRTQKHDLPKKSTSDNSISRRRNTEDKSTNKKSVQSESRSSSNSRRREEETKERKEKTDYHSGAKKKTNKLSDVKDDVLRKIKKEIPFCSGNDETEVRDDNILTDKQQQIYSDEGSQVSLSLDSKSSRKAARNLALFEDTFKRDKPSLKKRRIVVNKGRKERLKSGQKGASILSSVEEEMPLNLLLVKKSQRKKDGNKNPENNNPKLRHGISSSIVDHVSETINAVAENKTDEYQRSRKIKLEIESTSNDGMNFHRKAKVSCKTNSDPDFALNVVWPFGNVESNKKLVENFSDDEFGDLLCDDFDNSDNGFPIDKIIEISRENNGSDNITKNKCRAGETGGPLSLFANFYTGETNEKISCRQWSGECDPSKSHAVDIPRFDDSNSTFMPQDQISESHSISRNFKDIEKGLDVLDSMLETVDLEGMSKKDVKKGKRKRVDSDVNSSNSLRNTMTRSEMMNCSVRLVDCKYTYLKDSTNERSDQQCRIFNVISLRTQSDETGISENLFSPQRSEGEDWLLEKQEIMDENLLSINDEQYLNAESDMSFNNMEGNSVYEDDDDIETMKLQAANDEAGTHSEVPNPMEDMIQSYSISEYGISPNCSPTEICEIESSAELGLRAKPLSKLVDENVDQEGEIQVVDNENEGISASEEIDNDQNDEPKEIEEVELPTIQYSVHKGPILDVKVFGDSILAASEDGVIYRYSQTCNGILNTYEGHKSAVTCINVLQDITTHGAINTDFIFSASLDGSLRCFDITTSHQVRGAAEVGSPVQCMDQSWGMIFLGTKSGHVFRFNIKSHAFKGDEIKFSEESVLALKATTEGPRRVLIVASRSQPITIRDAQSGLFLRTVSGHKSHTVYSLLMDSNLVYCGTSSTAIPVFDFINGSQVKLYNAGPGIVCMRMYKWLLFAGCYDGNIYVFDTKEQRLVCSIPGPGNMLLSMDIVKNKIVAGSKDRRLHIWQMPEQVLTILAGET